MGEASPTCRLGRTRTPRRPPCGRAGRPTSPAEGAPWTPRSCHRGRARGARRTRSQATGAAGSCLGWCGRRHGPTSAPLSALLQPAPRGEDSPASLRVLRTSRALPPRAAACPSRAPASLRSVGAYDRTIPTAAQRTSWAPHGGLRNEHSARTATGRSVRTTTTAHKGSGDEYEAGCLGDSFPARRHR